MHSRLFRVTRAAHETGDSLAGVHLAYCRPWDKRAGMTERTVQVWGKPQIVTVHRESKSVRIAVGDYMGESISVKDRSEGAVLKRWREAASYKGG